MTRRIIHVDMDAFYAAVEQRDDPRLRGRPVIVGGNPHGRGVVATCSYEARQYGIRSAMPAAEALRRCPHAVFVPPDFARYERVSHQIRAIFDSYTRLVEPLSLDEAYLDVTDERGGLPTATAVARSIRARIRDELALTASAGVGPIKLVAKIASDIRKPDGLVVVRPAEVEGFLAPLPVARLWGVGPATEKRLRALGLHTIGDVAAQPRERLVAALGSSLGAFLHDLARGHDDRPVEPYREAKSHGAETTFERDLVEEGEMEGVIRELAAEVADAVVRGGRPGRTVTLKVRYADFTTVTRSQTLGGPTDRAEVVTKTALELLGRTEAARRPVRLLGVSLGNLVGEGEPVQLWLPF